MIFVLVSLLVYVIPLTIPFLFLFSKSQRVTYFPKHPTARYLSSGDKLKSLIYSQSCFSSFSSFASKSFIFHIPTEPLFYTISWLLLVNANKFERVICCFSSSFIVSGGIRTSWSEKSKFCSSFHMLKMFSWFSLPIARNFPLELKPDANHFCLLSNCFAISRVLVSMQRTKFFHLYTRYLLFGEYTGLIVLSSVSE